MTLAAKYNAKVHELMPHMAPMLVVDKSIDNSSQIDEIVFRRSEYLGGMAAVILALAEKSK